MESAKDQKAWPAWKYWYEELKSENSEIARNGESDISEALALHYCDIWKMNPSHRYIAKFAKLLDGGRGHAIKKLYQEKKEVYTVAPQGRIELLSRDRKYRNGHLSRLGKLKAARDVSTFILSGETTPDERRRYVLPSPAAKNSAQKLLFGESDETTLK